MHRRDYIKIGAASVSGLLTLAGCINPGEQEDGGDGGGGEGGDGGDGGGGEGEGGEDGGGGDYSFFTSG